MREDKGSVIVTGRMWECNWYGGTYVIKVRGACEPPQLYLPLSMK